MQSNYFIGGGIGYAVNKLNAFDAALLSAKVGNYNLVKVSSILPPHAVKQNSISVQQGSILHTAYSTLLCDERNQIISSGVGIAIPDKRLLPGVIMEHSSYYDKQTTRLKLEEMLAIAMNLRGIKEYSTEYFVIDAVVEDIFACTFSCVSLW